MEAQAKTKKEYDIKDVIAQVQEGAKKNVDQPRFIKDGEMKVGQCARQGDIYIHMVDASHEHGKLSASNQLAVGTSKGSRHIAELPAQCYEGTTLPSHLASTTFKGPCIVSSERFTISHPEHSDVVLAAGTYQISHQLDARSLKRVSD